MHEKIASELLTPIWKAIPSDYKAKYSYSIWKQFEDNLRSAAYTARLSRFLQAVTTRLGAQITEHDTHRITAFLKDANERETLKALREETALLVLYVRVANEERKEKFAQGKPKDRNFKAEMETQDGNDSTGRDRARGLFDFA